MDLEFTDLSSAWRAFFIDGRVSPGLRPMVLEAWKRSLAYGNLPGRFRAQTPDPARLERARQRSERLLQAADLLIAEIQSVLRGRPHAVVLLDDEGIVLRLRPPRDTSQGDGTGFAFEGARWLEKDIGCNGGGTALALGKPVVFIGPEHFSREHADLTCLGMPIRDPGDRICGAFTLSIPNALVDVDIWGWALSVGARLEQSLREGRSESELDHGSPSQRALGQGPYRQGGLDDPFHSVRGVMDFLIQELDLLPTYGKLVAQARDRLARAEERVARLLRDLDDSQEHLAAALQAAEVKTAELQAVFNTIDSAVYVIEEPRRFITANRAGLDLLGLDSMDDLKDGCELVLGGLRVLRDGGPHLLADDVLHTDTLRSGRATNVPARIRNLKGHDVDILVTVRPVIRPKDRLRRLVITVRDVTTLKSLERAKDEYLQVLSHELRNPLAAAFGLIQLISRRLAAKGGGAAGSGSGAGQGEDGVGRYLETAESELRRLNDLLTDILNGYRVSSGRLSLDLVPLDLTEVLSESVAPYAGPSQERPLILDMARGPVYILGDRQRLIEVMANLLSNATKY